MTARKHGLQVEPSFYAFFQWRVLLPSLPLVKDIYEIVYAKENIRQGHLHVLSKRVWQWKVHSVHTEQFVAGLYRQDQLPWWSLLSFLIIHDCGHSISCWVLGQFWQWSLCIWNSAPHLLFQRCSDPEVQPPQVFSLLISSNIYEHFYCFQHISLNKWLFAWSLILPTDRCDCNMIINITPSVKDRSFAIICMTELFLPTKMKTPEENNKMKSKQNLIKLYVSKNERWDQMKQTHFDANVNIIRQYQLLCEEL